MPDRVRNVKPGAETRAVFDACAALIVILDPEGRVLWFNRSCERLTGYTSAQVEGALVWDALVPPDELATARAEFRDVLTLHLPSEYEGHWVSRYGEERLIAWSQQPVIGADGEVEHVLCTGLDVTDSRRAQEELVQFRLGIERSGEIVFLTDREGRIRYVNPAFEAAYGFDREEVLGRTPRILKSGCHDRAFYERLWSTLLSGETASAEIINQTKDGRLLTIAATTNPVFGDEGRINGFLAIQRNITERKRTERALRESEERLRTVLDKSPDGIGVLDAEGVILYANPAISTILGYPSEELVGSRVDRFQHPDDRARAAARTAELFQGGPEGPAQYRLVRKDGTTVTAEITSRIIEYEGRLALLATMRDLTERLALEAQLRQAQKMEAIGQLAGGIAHDFNNLLTVVQVSSELIGHGMRELPGDVMSNLKELQGAVARGKDLIENLLAFSRREEMRIEPIDLGELIREFEPTLRRLLPEDIQIRIDVSGTLPKVLAGSGSIEQILLNLSTNARHAMPEGGVMTIAAAPAYFETEGPFIADPVVPGEFVRMAVTDEGLGMDESTRARVFEPFYTTRRTAGGTGLGMAVVYGLVKRLGGRVEVESEPGQGSTIEVYLPVADEIALGIEVPPEQGTATLGGSETILLTEDEPALRRAAKRSLERLGYRLLLAADGEEALEIFERDGEMIDLIVSDIVMPRRGGRALYAELRNRGAEVPFLFTSGYAAEEKETERLDPGLPFLPKPWSLDGLARRIREVLDARVG